MNKFNKTIINFQLRNSRFYLIKIKNTKKCIKKFDKIKIYVIIYLYLYFNYKNKMANKTKQRLVYKKESERTAFEKMCRDVACYGVTIFAALMGFLLVDANVSLANAESDSANYNVEMVQNLN